MDRTQLHEHEGTTAPLSRMAQRGKAKSAQQAAAFQAALSQAFGRMCANYPGLDGTISRVSRCSVSLAELVEMTEPGMFPALLEGPGDSMGMAWLCPVTLAALVEVQTTGQIVAAQAQTAAPRKPTRIDASLVAPMIDSFLHQIAKRCAGLPEADQMNGFLYGSFLDDTRPMGVVLEDETYELISMEIMLAQGRIAGKWTLVLPQVDKQQHPQAAPEPDTWESSLVKAVSASQASLNAVLCQYKLTLTEALALSKGDILRVPESSLETLTLIALDGTQMASGRLGQARGFRAIRVMTEPGSIARNDRFGAPMLRLAKIAALPERVPHPVDTPHDPARHPSGASSQVDSKDTSAL